MITKNILYKYFKDFADNHLQIKDYGYGDLSEISSSTATTYPLFWVSPQPSNISGNEITYNFNILIGDRLEDGDANKVEVESDTFQIGLDLLATLNINRDVDLDKNNTLTPFIHDFKDRIAGHLITVSVTADFDYNECAVPTTGTPTPPTSSCPVAIITINGVAYGSAASGGTEDIAVVDGFGTPVGSLVSGNWVVTASCPNASAVLKNTLGTTLSTTSIASGGSSDITAPDSTITINSASFSPYPSGVTSNILVKDGTGTQVGSKVGSEWIVPTGGGGASSGVLFKTIPPNQYTSYRTGDEGWRVQNGWFDYTPPTTPKTIAELDYTNANFFYILKNPLVVNGVSSTTRFVDVNGIQAFSTTGNADDVVIDKLTGLMYNRNELFAGSWNDCVDYGVAYSITVKSIVYDDWYLVTKDEMDLIFNNYAGTFATLDNVTGVRVLQNAYGTMWTASTSANVTTSAYYHQWVSRFQSYDPKSQTVGSMFVRNARNLITAP
jgi:hypothetical protein